METWKLELIKYIFGNPVFGINFNVVDEDGYTPLHEACLNGRVETVKFLLENSKEKGIDIEKKSNDQKSPFELAKECEDNEIVELFQNHRKTQQLKRKYNVAFA